MITAAEAKDKTAIFKSMDIKALDDAIDLAIRTEMEKGKSQAFVEWPNQHFDFMNEVKSKGFTIQCIEYSIGVFHYKIYW